MNQEAVSDYSKFALLVPIMVWYLFPSSHCAICNLYVCWFNIYFWKTVNFVKADKSIFIITVYSKSSVSTEFTDSINTSKCENGIPSNSILSLTEVTMSYRFQISVEINVYLYLGNIYQLFYFNFYKIQNCFQVILNANCKYHAIRA